ncbi:hypothetical protein [Cellulosimicrobium cellulans]|uniref:hypothetical protein n=1 Tax=Cellulosimicrobium cellulans TaxID=1710 RepID=UPI001BAAE9A5|nr:hypothetical protein [Cellulosimicrobium cellulans]QUC01227.1 hypothetical protein J5A69_08720 [Cellulosimicrobium cellulans]
MPWDSTPWFVGGGAQHSPEVARLLAYATSGGAEGVVEPGDLKVVPLAVPGGGVRVLPGGVLIRNRYAGGAQQTYAGRLPVQDTPAITATGSASGRSDLVVARVLDPQYEGEAPSDPLVFDYVRTEVIEGVAASVVASADAAAAYCRALPYPAIPLGGVTLPASTGTVTGAMVKDLRKVARPRTQRVVRALNNNDVHTLDSTSFVDWPVNANWMLEVPVWATHAVAILTASSVDPVWSGSSGDGYIRLQIGTGAGAVYGDSLTWQVMEVTDVQQTYTNGDEIAIPAAMRGTTQRFASTARRVGGTSRIRQTRGSSIVLDVEFQERAV